MKSATMVLMVGIPGSGKSTFAKKIQASNRFLNSVVIRETDEYFVDATTKKYNFDASKLAEYHALCQKMTEFDLGDGHDVIVANTNLSKWERKHYFDIARRCGCSVMVIIMQKQYGNIHAIPEDRIKLMQEKFEPISSDELDGIERFSITNSSGMECLL